MGGECRHKKMNSHENFEPNMCLESVNQITVWRVKAETCVESESMNKKGLTTMAALGS